MTYRGGLLAALRRGTGARAAAAYSDRRRPDGNEEGKERQNRHEESRYVDEHVGLNEWLGERTGLDNLD